MKLVAWYAALFFLLGVLAGLSGGCARTAVTPAESLAERETETIIDSQGRPARTVVRERVASTGAALETTEAEAVGEIDTEAPEVDLSRGRAGGGGMDLSMQELAGGASALYWIGGVALVVGLGIGFGLGQWGLGLGLSAAGAGVIGVAIFADRYPWVVWVLLAVALGVGGWFVYIAWRERKKDLTLDAVVRGVDAAGQPPTVTEEIRKAAGSAASTVRETVGAVKARAGL